MPFPKSHCVTGGQYEVVSKIFKIWHKHYTSYTLFMDKSAIMRVLQKLTMVIIELKRCGKNLMMQTPPYSEKIQYEKLLDLQICIFTDIVFLVLDFHSHKLES